jgi:hypothetical protein
MEGTAATSWRARKGSDGARLIGLEQSRGTEGVGSALSLVLVEGGGVETARGEGKEVSAQLSKSGHALLILSGCSPSLPVPCSPSFDPPPPHLPLPHLEDNRWKIRHCSQGCNR